MSEAIQAIEQVLARQGKRAKLIQEAWGGREHHVCKVLLDDGDAYVAKVPRRDGYRPIHWPKSGPLRPLRAEAEAIDRLRHVPVAKPSVIFEGDPPFALQPMLPGRPPERELMDGNVSKTSLEDLCLQMGKLLAAIHRTRFPGLDTETHIPLKVGCVPENARLLHMDYHLGNVLALRDLRRGWRLTGVVDWTCCQWGPREDDFIELGASLFATNPWAFDPFLVGYSRGSGQRLDARNIKAHIGRELRRRLEDEPPESEQIVRLWDLRMRQWLPAEELEELEEAEQG